MKHRTPDWENLAGEMYETLAQYQTCGAKKNPRPALPMALWGDHHAPISSQQAGGRGI